MLVGVTYLFVNSEAQAAASFKSSRSFIIPLNLRLLSYLFEFFIDFVSDFVTNLISSPTALKHLAVPHKYCRMKQNFRTLPQQGSLLC